MSVAAQATLDASPPAVTTPATGVTSPAMVSAHRGAEQAGHFGGHVDYVELDVQRCGDGTFVLFHNDHVHVDGSRIPVAGLTFCQFAALTGRALRYDDALWALARRGQRAHLDLKFVSPPAAYRDPASTFEVAATRLAVDALGRDNVIVTTLEDPSVLAVRRWACAHDLDELLVGLSLGRRCATMSRVDALRTHTSELFPHDRYLRCAANLVVAHHWLARLGVARFAAHRHLPLLVWTVDAMADLRYWLQPGRAWMVTTNRPEHALQIRGLAAWA
ncbi:MAG: glycerophosphodiester phosphodiesterase [Marmoricola sp.]